MNKILNGIDDFISDLLKIKNLKMYSIENTIGVLKLIEIKLNSKDQGVIGKPQNTEYFNPDNIQWFKNEHYNSTEFIKHMVDAIETTPMSKEIVCMLGAIVRSFRHFIAYEVIDNIVKDKNEDENHNIFDLDVILDVFTKDLEFSFDFQILFNNITKKACINLIDTLILKVQRNEYINRFSFYTTDIAYRSMFMSLIENSGIILKPLKYSLLTIAEIFYRTRYNENEVPRVMDRLHNVKRILMEQMND